MEIIKESIFSVHEGRWQTRKMFFYLEQPIEKEILNVLIKIPLKKPAPTLTQNNGTNK